MPERVVARKVETPDVQGEGSWILLRPMTVGEILALQREANKKPDLLARIKAVTKRLFRIRDGQPIVYESFARRMIGLVAGWNWVDEYGEPLPDPRQYPDVVLKLTDSELLAIANIVYGKDNSDEKN
jgi:hypothetical protein